MRNAEQRAGKQDVRFALLCCLTHFLITDLCQNRCELVIPSNDVSQIDSRVVLTCQRHGILQCQVRNLRKTVNTMIFVNDILFATFASLCRVEVGSIG